MGPMIAIAVSVLSVGSRCLRFAGVCFEPDTGANSSVATPAAPAATATPAAPVTQAPATQAVQTQAPAAIPTQSVDIAAVLGSLGQSITQAVTQAIAPLAQNQAQMAQQFQQLQQPQRSAQSLLFGGGAPAIRQGEDPLSSRGYEFGKALAFRQRALGAEHCKIELDIHQKLYDFYVTQNGMSLDSLQSILVPMGSHYLTGLEPSLAKEIQNLTRQSVLNVDPDMVPFLRQRTYGQVNQAISQWDATALGVFTNPGGGEFIQLLRNKEVFSRAGATDIALPPSGCLRFDRQTGATTAYWVGESSTITPSQPATGYIELRARKLATLVKFPNELVRFSSPTTEAMIRDDMATVLALKADSTFIDGIGSTVSPMGLLRYANVNSINASTLGTDGNTLEPQDLGLMVSQCEQDNIDPEVNGWAWLIRPDLFWKIMNKRVQVYNGSSMVETGEFVFDMNRSDISKGMPAMVLGYPVVKSNQIPRNRTKGSGTDLTVAIGGAFKHALIGRSGVMEFAVSTQGDTAFTTDQTWLRAIQHIDFAPRYEEAFVFCDKLLRN